MRPFIFTLLTLTSLTASSQTLCKPGPIGGCNWQEPFLVQEGNTIYQTRPGTTQRDWNADSWEVGKNGVARPKAPSALLPDYSKPGMVVGKDWKGDLMVTPSDANGYQQRGHAIRYNIKK